MGIKNEDFPIYNICWRQAAERHQGHQNINLKSETSANGGVSGVHDRAEEELPRDINEVPDEVIKDSGGIVAGGEQANIGSGAANMEDSNVNISSGASNMDDSNVNIGSGASNMDHSNVNIRSGGTNMLPMLTSILDLSTLVPCLRTWEGMVLIRLPQVTMMTVTHQRFQI